MTELTAQGGRPDSVAELDVDSMLRAARATPRDLWNDSADPDELAASIAIGAVGATCNPVIALTTLRKHADIWELRLRELARQNPTASNSDIGWLAVEELSTDAARLLEETFVQHHGRNGRLSVQTDPRLFRNAVALIAQAEHLSGLAPNIIVKIPATQVGIEAMREATFRGVNVNATVSFTVAQAVAVGEAIEDGLTRREAAGMDVSMMGRSAQSWVADSTTGSGSSPNSQASCSTPATTSGPVWLRSRSPTESSSNDDCAPGSCLRHSGTTCSGASSSKATSSSHPFRVTAPHQ